MVTETTSNSSIVVIYPDNLGIVTGLNQGVIYDIQLVSN